MQLHSYKHSKCPPPPIIIHCSNDIICKFKNFIDMRGSASGPMFCNPSGHAIKRAEFVSHLKFQLGELGLNQVLYNSHSFRIGKATDMHKKGFSDSQIASVGRWSSQAYKKYIKPSYIHSN